MKTATETGPPHLRGACARVESAEVHFVRVRGEVACANVCKCTCCPGALWAKALTGTMPAKASAGKGTAPRTPLVAPIMDDGKLRMVPIKLFMASMKLLVVPLPEKTGLAFLLTSPTSPSRRRSPVL
jgi:hypothetical protein